MVYSAASAITTDEVVSIRFPFQENSTHLSIRNASPIYTHICQLFIL